MPDTRKHRGAHPEDAGLFSAAQLPALQRAAGDLAWLIDRGYALRSSLALVGDRHALRERQRLALARCTCSDAQRERRGAHQVPESALAGQDLWIDGYNLLITVETALSGGIILRGRDGCCRDLASLHGTYRAVSETEPALRLIGEMAAAWGAARCHWVLDTPVSNSGRLKTAMLELARAQHWPWEVQLEFSPDKVLSDTRGIIATSDSMVLDRCESWFNAAAAIISVRVPHAFVVDLS